MRPERVTMYAGFAVLLLSLPLVLGGCFAMQKDLDPVRSDISVMEKQFMELQREQARLSARMDETGPGGGSAGSDEAMQRIRRLEARLDALEGRSGGQAGAPRTFPPAPAAPIPMEPEPVMIEPIPETEAQPPVLVTRGEAPTAPPRASMPAEDIYAGAMNSYKAGDMAAAEGGFGRLLAEYPDNRLADNAAYWLGEINFSRKEYGKAIDSFKKVVSDYPIGDKVPDAVYMMGRSYEELGQPDKAREAYNRVMDNYPYSDAARNARQRMDGIY